MMRKITTANESERLNLPRNRARQGDASCWSHHWTRRVGAEGALVASQPRRRACPGGLRTARPATATCPAARPCPRGQKASRPEGIAARPGAALPWRRAGGSTSSSGQPRRRCSARHNFFPGGQPRRRCSARLAFFPDIYGKEPWRDWRIGAGAEYKEELERNGEDIELGCAAVDDDEEDYDSQ